MSFSQEDLLVSYHLQLRLHRRILELEDMLTELQRELTAARQKIDESKKKPSRNGKSRLPIKKPDAR